MEVHHHTHTSVPDSHRGRKKWTHYFWEFLMLFLAVFCGFLAENKREHYVEHLRAPEYAKSLVEDLSADTVELLDVVNEYGIILQCFDSIANTIHKGIKNNVVPGSFYYYCNIGTFSPTVVWSNATLTQLTQSGNLRYFKDRELLKKLSIYFSRSDFVTVLTNGDKGYRDECIKLRGRVLNNYHYSHYSAFNILSWLKVPDSLLQARIPLQNSDPLLLNEFANSFETRRRVLTLLMTRDYTNALSNARELIAMLKKEYNLD